MGFKTPQEVWTAITTIGYAKSSGQKPLPQTLLLGVMAGVLLGFGATASTLVAYGLMPAATAAGGHDAAASSFSYGPGIVKAVYGFLFPVGLVLIIVAGGDLLTSTMMYCTAVVLDPPEHAALPRWRIALGSLRSMAMAWGANFCGCLLMAVRARAAAAPAPSLT
eukprot:tig00021070_g17891.t1